MDFQNYYLGMHIIWWALGIILFCLIFLIFLIPSDCASQKLKKESAHNLLQNRFIIGDITELEYNDKKKILHKKFYIS
jgi:putative membrane protein